MLIIRFARRGRKNLAFFHLVVAEKARSAKKKFIEKLGFLNPHAKKKEEELFFDAEKIQKYINFGAQLSQRAARELVRAGFSDAGKFVIARKSKPKKEKKEEKNEVENTEKKVEKVAEKTETEKKENEEKTEKK